MKQFLKPVLILIGIIIIASVISKVLNKSETLTEYAARDKATHSAESTELSTELQPETSNEQEATTTSPTAESNTVTDTASTNEETVDVTLSFYYEPLSDELINKITGISYVENENISLDDLRYVHILHYNFDSEAVEGELICNEAIAQDLLEIFYELYLAEYKIEKVRLIDEYDGNDTASMEDNNTSCFNYRVVDGTTKLSKHAYGLAIDINPFYNPYVVFQSDGSTYISPKGSEAYTDRSSDFPYKIDENDLCYKLFKEHGFTWGGDWNSCKDYQHFQKAK
ncbi:MAG: M15 family metallopeptidase [Lachnospiraceae bacterium]|nr:M15 family metallopeptidase [Lachnospiraceae bacterium]